MKPLLAGKSLVGVCPEMSNFVQNQGL